MPVWVGPGGVTEVGVAVVTAVVLLPEPETPTQYASSAQNPDRQSEETAGFQAWKSASEIPKAASTVPQSSLASLEGMVRTGSSPRVDTIKGDRRGPYFGQRSMRYNWPGYLSEWDPEQ
jgi:hypothetical protein